jgi:hypothetical protein
MKNARFLHDVKLYPSRYYRNPADVVRDRHLTNADRLEILAAWERDARGEQDCDALPGWGSEPLPELRRMREELRRPEGATHGHSMDPGERGRTLNRQ